MQTITLTYPDDWHLHLRDGELMKFVLRHVETQFKRAIIMPNLNPPVTTAQAVRAYHDRICACIEGDFQPLMTLYLTDQTSVEVLREALPLIHGVKLYPAGATTFSHAGVTKISKVMPVLEYMAEQGLPLLIHGEVTDPQVDIFDREAVFIDTLLVPLIRRLPQLKIVLEHISTAHAVDFIVNTSHAVAATITAHHLLMNRNALFQEGIRPHHYCLPVLKKEKHRQRLLEVIASGHPRFFLGSDSAPHDRQHKEACQGCAGIYTSHACLPLYAEAFEEAGALDKLEAFASQYGPDFYQLPKNKETLTLVKKNWNIPSAYRLPALGNTSVVPLRAAQSISWQVVHPSRDFNQSSQ